MFLSEDKSLTIYAFPGLGTDHRIFTYLDLNAKVVHVPWKIPRRKDNLKSYAQYLVEDYDLSGNYAFLGVSFGGMVASELQHIFNPVFVCLVASVKSHLEMPRWLRSLRYVYPLWLLPAFCFKPPFALLKYPLGIANPRHLDLFRDFYRASSPVFLKRSIRMIASWQQNSEYPSKNMIHIHGDRDKLFPFHKIATPKQQLNGTHFLIVTGAKHINAIINEEINRLNTI